MKLSDHLALSREERQKHLDLSTPCDLAPEVKAGARRHRLKRDLLKLLNLENDVKHWRRGGVCSLTHQCEHHSLNGLCCNPLHVSFGTWAENQSDVDVEVRKVRSAKAGTVATETLRNHPDWGSLENNSKGWHTATVHTWVDLTDGFVGNCLNVGRHGKTLGHDPTLRLKLTSEQVVALTPLLEEFEWKVPRKGRVNQFRRVFGTRVPLDVLETLKTQG